MSGTVRYPKIKVKLSCTDGNAFSVIGRVSNALRDGGAGETELSEFFQQATSGSYDDLLQTCMQWVIVS